MRGAKDLLKQLRVCLLALQPHDILVQKLQVARRELQLEAAIAKLDKFDLLILDDLAYVTKDQAETSVLFELICAVFGTESIRFFFKLPLEARSSAVAAGESLRDSNTATTTQGDVSFSVVTHFVLNSTGNLESGSGAEIIPALLRGSQRIRRFFQSVLAFRSRSCPIVRGVRSP